MPGSKPRKLSLSRPNFFEVLALYLDTRGICFIKRDAVLVRRKRERERYIAFSFFFPRLLFFPLDARFLIEPRKFDDRKVVLYYHELEARSAVLDNWNPIKLYFDIFFLN